MTEQVKNKWLAPAEWEEHEALFLAWPHDKITFPNRIEKVETVFIQIIKAIHTTELVHLLVLDSGMKEDVLNLMKNEDIDFGRVIFHEAPYADVWMRDYAPFFVKDINTGEKAWIKWEYNAYGNKFPTLVKDNEVFINLQDAVPSPMIEAGIVMEGGAIECNGKGTLITTQQCLLNPNRNPDLSKEEIEDYLKQYTGATKIIWLKEGIVNDHTDGHIDDFVKFVDAHTVVCAYEDDQNDPNFAILSKAYNMLIKETDQDGNILNVIKLPMPHFNYDDGTKAPASYVNFYIGNDTVLVPVFNDPNDRAALETIASLFPKRATIGIDCTDLIYGGGTIHCITQQEPV